MTGQPDRRARHEQDQPPPGYDDRAAPLRARCPLCTAGWHARCMPDLWWCTCTRGPCLTRLLRRPQP